MGESGDRTQVCHSPGRCLTTRPTRQSEGKKSGERKQLTVLPLTLGMTSVNLPNTWTVLKATLRRFLRDGAEHIWTFPSAMMPSSVEIEIWPLSHFLDSS